MEQQKTLVFARAPPMKKAKRNQLTIKFKKGESQGAFHNVHYSAVSAWVFSPFLPKMYKIIGWKGRLT